MMRIYRHLNPGTVDAHPTNSSRARIGNAQDVIHWIRRTHQHIETDGTVTATFIVDTDRYLWIADRHSEHAACAAGRDILSAGEITFSVSDLAIAVTLVTNQSLGYCPEPESWIAVATALQNAKIKAPDGFSAAFIFRRCSQCGATNVVKEGWFVCDVCAAELSKTWNFEAEDQP